MCKNIILIKLNYKIQTLHLIIYGCGDSFDINLFQPIKNRNSIKPFGGLWASPINSTYSWKDWCRDNDFGDCSSQFEIECTGNTIIIDSFLDLDNLIWQKSEFGSNNPDYEKMLEFGIDMIYLTEYGQHETRFSDPGLYGYDCECVLIMNPMCVKIP